MRNLRRIDVLLNEETGEEFHEGDIIKISTGVIPYLREIIGKISCIETLEITLDRSKEYKSYVDRIKFEDISKIKKIK